MKQFFFILLGLFFLSNLYAADTSFLSQKKSEINIATYNIRYNNFSDKANAWPNRKDWVKNLILYHEFDIFGVQEALHDQMMDLAAIPDFSYVGVGRDDGNTKGEYSAIFYNNKKFEVLQSGNFWLSDTPEKPSMGWDAACIRICTWACFNEIGTDKQFYMFNTHFDHIGINARENSAKLILKKTEAISTKNLPVIITGDFNSNPTTNAYGTIVKKFFDSKLVSKTQPYGSDITFNNFDYHNYSKDNKTERIDFIFVNDKIEVLKYGVLTDSKEEKFPSDHFPVAGRLRF